MAAELTPATVSNAGVGQAVRAKGAEVAQDAADQFTLGEEALDGHLDGGLVRAGLHEIFPSSGADQPAASGFALALLVRAAPIRGAIVWVRCDALAAEAGRPYGPGLSDWGLDPRRILFVRVRSMEDALRALGEAARTPGLGGALLETWGEDRRFDLTASRRLALRAEAARVPLFLARAAAAPAPSAAWSRWRVRAVPSRPLPADAPGPPAFEIELLRRRNGAPGGPWRLEWMRDDAVFRLCAPRAAQPAAPAPRALFSLPFDGSGAPGPRRRTG
jgi:protein ImuA